MQCHSQCHWTNIAGRPDKGLRCNLSGYRFFRWLDREDRYGGTYFTRCEQHCHSLLKETASKTSAVIDRYEEVTLDEYILGRIMES